MGLSKMEDNRLVGLAENYLLELFSDGKTRKATDLEKECWGFIDSTFFMYGPKWFNTHWVVAMRRLVDSEMILAYKNSDEEWCYEQNKKPINYDPYTFGSKSG